MSPPKRENGINILVISYRYTKNILTVMIIVLNKEEFLFINTSGATQKDSTKAFESLTHLQQLKLYAIRYISMLYFVISPEHGDDY